MLNFRGVVARNRQGAEAMSISRAKRKEEAEVWEGKTSNSAMKKNPEKNLVV